MILDAAEARLHRHAAGQQADPAVAHHGGMRTRVAHAGEASAMTGEDERRKQRDGGGFVHAAYDSRPPTSRRSPACRSSNASTTAPSVELKLARPPVNALNPALCSDLPHARSPQAVDDGVQGIVLSGGPKVFSAGLDVPYLLRWATIAPRCSPRGRRSSPSNT